MAKRKIMKIDNEVIQQVITMNTDVQDTNSDHKTVKSSVDENTDDQVLANSVVVVEGAKLVHNNDKLFINEIIKEVNSSMDEEDLNELTRSLGAIGTNFTEVLSLSDKSEFEISRYVAKLFNGRVCYNISTETWYIFNGVLWVRDIQSQYMDYFQHFVVKSVDLCINFALNAKDEQYRNLLPKLIHVLGLFNKISDVQKYCDAATKGKDGIGYSGDRFDSDLRYIGAPNGIIDLESLELLQGNPKILLTKSLPVEYNPEANAPARYINFLKDIFCNMLPMPEMPTLQIIPEKPRLYDFNLSFGDEEEKIQKWQKECENIRRENELIKTLYDEEVRKIDEQNFINVEEVISFLQRLFGYILTGRCNEHIFIIFFGQEGRNGKGVLVRLMMKVLGDYGGEVQPEILLKNNLRSSSGPSPEVLDLMGKRFVVASETNQGEVFNTGCVKRLTGGDTLIGRALYGRDMVRFSPTHTICLQTNYAPNAAAEDTAFWSRVISLNFNRVFVDNPEPNNPLQLQKNNNIEEELFEERESVLKWIIDGVRLYKENGLLAPKSIDIMKKTYQVSTDIINDFIDECCTVELNDKVKVSELTITFNKWCQENGYKVMNKRTITDKLARKKFRKEKKGYYYYIGISLNHEGEEMYKRAMIKNGEKYI